MTKPPTPPKPDLTEYEDEAVPFDDVLRRLLGAEPGPKPSEAPTPPAAPEE